MSKPTNILIIDDNESIRRLYGAKLAGAGFDVLYSSNGDDGREVARRMRPDLILLDIRMPGTDGYTIAKRLSSEPQTKNIPVVFLTNEDLTLEAESAVKGRWVVDYIHKSIDLGDFVKKIKEILILHKKNEVAENSK